MLHYYAKITMVKLGFRELENNDRICHLTVGVACC